MSFCLCLEAKRFDGTGLITTAHLPGVSGTQYKLSLLSCTSINKVIGKGYLALTYFRLLVSIGI